MSAFEILKGINMGLQIGCFRKYINRIVCLDHGSHGRSVPFVNGLNRTERYTFSVEHIFLSVKDQGSARQNIKIRVDPPSDHFPDTHQGPAGTDPEETAPLLIIKDGKNIRCPQGFFVSHKI